MFKLYLGDKEVDVIVQYKDNKNTYFRFKGNNTITVNASKLQSHKEIKKYILNNHKLFLRKLNYRKETFVDDESYYLFGEKYRIDRNSNNVGLLFDHDKLLFKIPETTVDHEHKILTKFNKSIMINELNILYEKYANNGYIDISKLNIRTRYMKTRFGSCNPVKRNININLNLLHYDKKFLEYVFLHEITHLVVRDHSSKFYKLLSKICIDYKPLRKELNKIYRHRWYYVFTNFKTRLNR